MSGDNSDKPYPPRMLLPVHPHRVGTTLPVAGASWPSTVHPHHVGTTISSTCRRVERGSPPHVWGQRTAACSEAFLARFTPTHVGYNLSRSLVIDHYRGSPPPRVGTTKVGVFNCRYDGFTPHTWGQQSSEAMRPLCARFTPTRVGTTSRQDPAGLRAGSPPHTWGQRKGPG